MHSLSPEAQRLYALYQWVLMVLLAGVWLVVGVPSLWSLRLEIGRLLEFFTWAGLKYSFLYKPQWPSIGLIGCLCFSLYVLLSYLRYRVVGLLPGEKALLETQVDRIRRLPTGHPLRRWVYRPKELSGGSP